MFCLGQNEKSKYTIVNRFSFLTDGGNDYLTVDENTNRLFVPHGMITQVVDSKTSTLIGTMERFKIRKALKGMVTRVAVLFGAIKTKIIIMLPEPIL